jgi:hypothetical protein
VGFKRLVNTASRPDASYNKQIIHNQQYKICRMDCSPRYSKISWQQEASQGTAYCVMLVDDTVWSGRRVPAFRSNRPSSASSDELLRCHNLAALSKKTCGFGKVTQCKLVQRFQGFARSSTSVFRVIILLPSRGRQRVSPKLRNFLT